jgi:hypothetical protein
MPTLDSVRVIAGHDPDVKPLTWEGHTVNYEKLPKHYLHISVSRCKKCQGPLIGGWAGTKNRDIERETEITPMGLMCLSCGAKPERTAPRDAELFFRPVEWEGEISGNIPSADDSPDLLSAELSQDSDSPLQPEPLEVSGAAPAPVSCSKAFT